MDPELLRDVDLVLLPGEPYRFRRRHVTELVSLPGMRAKPIALIDGEMTSWYGSRAIAAMGYLRRLRTAMIESAASAP